MAGQYNVSYAGEDDFARQEFYKIAEIFNQPDVVIRTYHAPPARARTGMLAVADGVDWDPLTVGVPRLVWFNGTVWGALDT